MSWKRRGCCSKKRITRKKACCNKKWTSAELKECCSTKGISERKECCNKKGMSAELEGRNRVLQQKWDKQVSSVATRKE